MSATTGGLKSKLRETLKQEDAALAERGRAVAEPDAEKRADAPVLDTPAPGEADRPEKHEKVERDSFSMPAREHKRIKALREALGKEGVLVSKSELLRAGLALLAARDTGEIARLVAGLPKVEKGKRKKR